MAGCLAIDGVGIDAGGDTAAGARLEVAGSSIKFSSSSSSTGLGADARDNDEDDDDEDDEDDVLEADVE